MLFNPEESVDFHGFTGPFIQYTHARIRSVLRKAEGMRNEARSFPDKNLAPIERTLLLQLNQFPGTVAEAAREHHPAHIANYVYHLAKTYNSFYGELPILTAENPDDRFFRIQLSEFVATVIQKSMALLGIEVPERM